MSDKIALIHALHAIGLVDEAKAMALNCAASLGVVLPTAKAAAGEPGEIYVSTIDPEGVVTKTPLGGDGSSYEHKRQAELQELQRQRGEAAERIYQEVKRSDKVPDEERRKLDAASEQMLQLNLGVELFLIDVETELAKARTKFPSSEASFTALTEEVGELAKALLSESQACVYREAVQVAAMVVRVAMEGDKTLDSYRTAHAPSWWEGRLGSAKGKRP